MHENVYVGETTKKILEWVCVTGKVTLSGSLSRLARRDRHRFQIPAAVYLLHDGEAVIPFL